MNYIPFTPKGDPLDLATKVAKHPTIRATPLFFQLFCADCGLDHRDFAEYSLGRKGASWTRFNIRHDEWFLALAAKHPRAAEWLTIPRALGVREGGVRSLGSFALRPWDFAHIVPTRSIRPTPQMVLAILKHQGLYWPELERHVVEGELQLLNSPVIQARTAAPWVTHLDEAGDTPEQLAVYTKNHVRTLEGCEDLMARQTFKLGLVAVYKAVWNNPVDGRCLPGTTFADPGFMFYGENYTIAPAGESRRDDLNTAVAPIGLDMRGAAAMWPQRIAPNGVDHLVEVDRKYPYVHARFARYFNIATVEQTAIEMRLESLAVSAAHERGYLKR